MAQVESKKSFTDPKSTFSLPAPPPLPIDSILADLGTTLAHNSAAVLRAPPGAGKTTRVPLALLAADWLHERKILLLEPRRLAARAAAFRMADTLEEPVGRTVGYRMRMDSRIGPHTRIEVVTEGVLTRMLQSDPSLEGVGLVIFDEFHERSLHADLGLALCLDVQGVLNTDLRLLVMSATLDTAPVAALLGDVPVVACQGQAFPVETRYVNISRNRAVEPAVARTVSRAAAEEDGSILVFLPGAAEIARVERLLAQSGLGPEWRVAPLYGHLSRAQQDLAITPPPPGKRKIVLATAIAETSLTIEGIRIVVDSGLMRVPKFDVRSGMTRLETRTVTRSSADQRRGRAGRVCPGICFRLWSSASQVTLTAHNRPEILEADMVPLALQLSVWGVTDPNQLTWLAPPPEAAFAQALGLLQALQILDETAKVTRHGRRAAELPLHPRLAHMVLKAQAEGQGASACDAAALLSERDFLRFAPGQQDADLTLRLDILQKLRQGVRVPQKAFTLNISAGRRITRVADNLRRSAGISLDPAPPPAAGRLLAWAYPDRIARRRQAVAEGRYLLTNGRGAVFTSPQPLAAEDYLVVADLDGSRREARIYLAAAYDEKTLFDQYGGQVQHRETVKWDLQRKMVTATETQHLGAVTLSTRPLRHPDPDAVLTELINGIRREGIGCLPWTKSLLRFQARARFVGTIVEKKGDWPDVSDEGLEKNLTLWLAPYLTGITRLRDLDRIELAGALKSLFAWDQKQSLDRLAPTHWTVPSGSHIPVDYSGDPPVLAVRLQEMFGLRETPAVAGGRQPLLIHLLSPAGRPVQVTQDLAGFWKSGYVEVKKELKGRYPKHYWPDDPIAAPPTNRAKIRGIHHND